MGKREGLKEAIGVTGKALVGLCSLRDSGPLYTHKPKNIPKGRNQFHGLPVVEGASCRGRGKGKPSEQQTADPRRPEKDNHQFLSLRERGNFAELQHLILSPRGPGISFLYIPPLEGGKRTVKSAPGKRCPGGCTAISLAFGKKRPYRGP